MLADDESISILNGQYRGIDGPTDVLSFSQRESSVLGWDFKSHPNTEESHPDTEENLLGDVMISVETALRQASERGADLDSEIDVLLVHGLLHLLGHDHAEPEEAEAMFARQTELLGDS